jgi:hypothetical protein
MFGKVSAEDQNIVKVDEDLSMRDFNRENVVHHRLKGGGGVGQSEEHNCWFIQATIGSKSRFVLIALADANIVVAPANV